MNQFKYQIVITSFIRGPGDIAHYETINSNSLIDILGRLPLIVATILEKERLEAIRISIDDDIPF